ncbi:PUA-like domain-containing protein [Irpex rosettiformis]|uniref:PUA-like domain-containing protein n=1 Tax=Irpex rosettiformis TaxID=378272 RepID=A0ACB8UEH6_9APHY|nr:PUA-like domain-containing protein [Irpex rosettiformis]
MPDTILPLLRCPLCPFSTLLESPITLHCGHTVCSKHVIRPHASSASFADSPATALLSSIFSSSAPGAFRCPLPTCTKRNAETQPAQVHPESGVNFRPAPPGELPLPHSPGEDPNVPRVDVTVNKILSLTTRTHRSLSSPELVEPMGQNDDDMSPEEHNEIHHPRPMIPPSGPSTSPPFPSSDSASHSFPPNPSTPVRRHRSDSCSPPPSPTLPNSPPPRKRRRLPSSVPPSPHRNSPRPQAARSLRPTSDRHALSALFEKELLSELTCEICFALLWQPVTTPCQHTFCSKCLLRSMDHSSACPLCRQELPGYVYAQDLPCNKLVLLIISKAFPISYAERGETIEAEERDSRLDTPIFVCQLSFPGMPTMLHLFEPRYRLMLRRCLAKSNPCFGMIPPPRPTATPASPGNDFGTMLRIKNVQMLPDGRSVVETWGTWRFRIMERGMLDGYVVARVERVEDHEESIYESDEANVEDILEIPTTTTTQAETIPMPGLSVPGSSSHLMEICHAFLEQLKQGTPWVVQHLERTIVPMPTDPAQFSFWMALLLPIDEHEKAKLLPIRSPRLRLRLVVHWIEQLRSHW